MLLSGLPAPLAAPRAGPIEHRAWCRVKCLRHLSVERSWRPGSRSRTRRRPPRPRTRVRATDARTPAGTAPRATTRPPPAPRDRRSPRPTRGLAGGTASRAPVSASPAIAARAATSDQWPLRVQAPNASEPGPNRLHGSAVARTASPNAASANVLIRGPGSVSPGPSSRRRRGRGRPRGTRSRSSVLEPASSTRGTSGVRIRRTARPPGSPGGGRIGRAPSTSVRPVARPKGTVTPVAVDGSGLASLACAT